MTAPYLFCGGKFVTCPSRATCGGKFVTCPSRASYKLAPPFFPGRPRPPLLSCRDETDAPPLLAGVVFPRRRPPVRRLRTGAARAPGAVAEYPPQARGHEAGAGRRH